LKKRSQRLFVSLLFAVATRAFAADIKVTTWNLNWLTQRSRQEAALPADVHVRAPEDFARLAGYVTKLGADVVAFQEVDGQAAAQLVFDPAIYAIATIDEPVTQRVGIAVRKKTVHMHANPDLAGLDAEPGKPFRLRYGLDVTLTGPGSASLRLLVVHLKTGCQTDDIAVSHRPQCALLARQIPALSGWIAARRQEGVPFMVLGDFNRVFDQPEELGDALAKAAPLLRRRALHRPYLPRWPGPRLAGARQSARAGLPRNRRQLERKTIRPLPGLDQTALALNARVLPVVVHHRIDVV
jgi:endonuclease/exonuclease/phosphatase family metal-dependent hydrolase